MSKIKKLWCYLNISNPIVAWEVAIGRISSIDTSVNLTEETRRSFLSLWQYSRLKIGYDQGVWQPFINEMEIENTRHNEFPKKVSRMRGCYFFESRKMALDVVQSFNWKGVGFKEEYLSEIEFIYDEENNFSVYDSAWMSSEMSKDEIESYLTGEAKYLNPASEFLCYGRGVVLNQDLIKNAEEIVRESFPSSTAFLDSAKTIFHELFYKKFSNGEVFECDAYHVGQVSPFIRNLDDEHAEVIILMSDSAFKKYGVIKDGRELVTPDLRKHMFKISKSQFLKANSKTETVGI